MRILALTHLYPRIGNDLFGTYNRHQLHKLSLHNDVRLIVPIPWTSWFTQYGAHSFCPRNYQNKDGIWIDHPVYFFPPKILQWRYGAFYLASVRHTFRRVVKEFRPEVIYACWSHPDGWAAVRLAREHGLPVLIKVVGSDVLVLSSNPRRRRFVADALREADGVVAVSRDLADRVIGLGVDARRISIVPEGIDAARFSPGDQSEARATLGLGPFGESHLLFVGNLLFSKGAGVLLEACSLLRSRGVGFRCHFVGHGHDEEKLRAIAGKLGVSDIVNFVGPCPQSHLADWYRACDLVVLPSFSEGIPNVLREAMMCGRGFIATRVGGIPEIARPQVGRLVDPGNAPQLAEAVERALAEGFQADRQTALEINVTWEQSARMLGDRLHEIVSHPAPSTLAPSEPIESVAVNSPNEGNAPGRSRPLRLLAITQLFPRPGNLTIGIHDLIQFREIAKSNPLALLAPAPWTHKLDRRLHADGKIPAGFEGEIDVVRPTFIYPPRVLRASHGSYFLRSIRNAAQSSIARHKPDIVIGCWAYPDGWAAVRLAREHGLPVIVKVHGSDVLILSQDRRRLRRVAEVLREADGVVAVSRDLAEHVIRLGADRAKVHFVPNGIDAVRFSPGDQSEARARLGLEPAPLGEFHLLFVGNLLFSKGAGLLLQACSLLRGRGMRFRCHLVGRGADEGRLRAMAQELTVADIVNFAGPCSQSHLADWYRACDLVVLPSFSEGIPNVLREAMMCGRGFIATRVGGIPEITRPQVGRLVDPGNVPQLADAIEQALTQGFRADRQTALELNVSWEQSAKMLLDIATLVHGMHRGGR
ncbi:MAG TPA: glycosyltransferase [Humisphaera sp.]|nr:glycosyltransferase [Humisphaera sp.]